MSEHKKNKENTFAYLSSAITLAAPLPGLDKPKYAGIALDLVYQNLEWSGILDPSQAQKKKNQ